MTTTAAGTSPPTGNELLVQFRTEMENALGVKIDWGDDTVLGAISVATANMGGNIAGGGQAIWDAFDPANATGLALDSIGAIRGVYRQAATYSSVALTLSGTAGTVIPSGSLVQGGGADGQARWRLSASVVLDGSGSGSVVAQAVETGAIAAEANVITSIVTPVFGWTAVTNPALANAGQDVQTDQAYRLAQLQQMQRQGSRNPAALRGQLLNLKENGVAFVESCVVLDNPAATATVIGGLTFRPHSFAPVIWPDTLTDSQKKLVAETIYPCSFGIWSQGPTTTNASGVATVVTGADGWPHAVRWYWAVPEAIPIAIEVQLRSGYALEDVELGIQEAVTTLVASLAVGETLYLLDVTAATVAVNAAAIVGVTVTLDGSAANYVPAATGIIQVDGSIVVTEAP